MVRRFGGGYHQVLKALRRTARWRAGNYEPYLLLDPNFWRRAREEMRMGPEEMGEDQGDLWEEEVDEIEGLALSDSMENAEEGQDIDQGEDLHAQPQDDEDDGSGDGEEDDEDSRSGDGEEEEEEDSEELHGEGWDFEDRDQDVVAQEVQEADEAEQAEDERRYPGGFPGHRGWSRWRGGHSEEEEEDGEPRGYETAPGPFFLPPRIFVQRARDRDRRRNAAAEALAMGRQKRTIQRLHSDEVAPLPAAAPAAGEGRQGEAPTGQEEGHPPWKRPRGEESLADVKRRIDMHLPMEEGPRRGSSVPTPAWGGAGLETAQKGIRETGERGQEERDEEATAGSSDDEEEDDAAPHQQARKTPKLWGQSRLRGERLKQIAEAVRVLQHEGRTGQRYRGSS